MPPYLFLLYTGIWCICIKLMENDSFYNFDAIKVFYKIIIPVIKKTNNIRLPIHYKMDKSKLERKTQRKAKEEEYKLLSFANFKLCISSGLEVQFCLSPSFSIKTGLRRLRKIQKQPIRSFRRKSCSEDVQQIYRSTLISKYSCFATLLKSNFSMGVLL